LGNSSVISFSAFSPPLLTVWCFFLSAHLFFSDKADLLRGGWAHMTTMPLFLVQKGAEPFQKTPDIRSEKCHEHGIESVGQVVHAHRA